MQRKCLNFVCLNIRSVKNKTTSLFEFIVSKNVGYWDGDYVSQLPYVWYYFCDNSSFKHDREECESKRAYVY